MTSTSPLLPGTEVHARGLRWEVVGSESLGQQTLYRLRGLESSVLGHELDILFPFEPLTPVRHDLRPERAAPFTNWLVYHQAFLLEQALGAHALLSVQPGRLRIEPYQLVPVLRAIRMSRVRLLLADGVGLGKTIQAGLVITELVARRLAHRVLIVSPAGPLMEQWQVEMSERFGLRLEVIDRTKIEDIRRSTELGSNPFDHIPLGLVSIDFLKQDRVLSQLERASYDVVVIDEAHHCMDVGSGQNREDSQRRRLAEVLARRCDALILATATPHDGHDRSFASLCELLDPSLIDGRGSLRGDRYRPHVVRRLKGHIIDPGTGKSLFKTRVVTPVPVTADPQKHARFVELQRGLLDLVAPELRRAFRNRSYSDVLAWMALLKRSVSTAAACGETLRVVADRYQQFVADTAELQNLRRERLRTLKDYQRKLDRFGAISTEEEQERSLLEAEDLAQQLAEMHKEIRRGSYKQSKVSDVVSHLDNLVSLAEEARHQDPKLDELTAAIRTIRRDEPKANILVYTEYVDSQKAAIAALKSAKLGPVIAMSGDDNETTRAEITERFRSDDNLILVSTDSSAEGLNLHQRCHHLIHLELPFNPNRLEQRNGRIDRYGQHLEPRVQYLYLRGTFEERILLRLIAKYEKQRAQLTFVPNTLGVTASSDAFESRLLKGIMDEDTKLFRDEPMLFSLVDGNENEGTDESAQELLEEIDRSLRGFREAAKTHAWLGDAGLNAEAKLVEEASQAREEGSRAEQVDLAQFVRDSVLLDGGAVEGALDADVFTIRVPPAWTYGLDHLPGYSPSDRCIRLTTRLNVTSDAQGNSVGFLGRAHPLVRRAIDRVRNLSFGGAAGRGQDPRTSAVAADISEPQLIYTFIGRVSSRQGRELERVLAVRITPTGQVEYYDSADAWSHWIDPAKALRTTGLWEQHFTHWAAKAEPKAHSAATKGFAPLASEFVQQRKQALQQERENQQQWLASRAEEVTGVRSRPALVQRTLLPEDQQGGEPTRPTADWVSLDDPAERLAAFYSDRDQTPAARVEAEGVLRIHQQRMKLLDDLYDLQEPEITLLGLLMLVPQAK